MPRDLCAQSGKLFNEKLLHLSFPLARGFCVHNSAKCCVGAKVTFMVPLPSGPIPSEQLCGHFLLPLYNHIPLQLCLHLYLQLYVGCLPALIGAFREEAGI